MYASATWLPTPEGPGSVSGEPNLPGDFTGPFTSRYIVIGYYVGIVSSPDSLRGSFEWYRALDTTIA